jgi:hypothetical protein
MYTGAVIWMSLASQVDVKNASNCRQNALFVETKGIFSLLTAMPTAWIGNGCAVGPAGGDGVQTELSWAG